MSRRSLPENAAYMILQAIFSDRGLFQSAAELMNPAKAKNNKTNLFIAVECFLIKNKHFIGNQTNNFRIK